MSKSDIDRLQARELQDAKPPTETKIIEKAAHEIVTLLAEKYGGRGPYYLDGRQVIKIIQNALDATRGER